MKNKITVFLFILINQIAFCQSAGEKIIHGKIITSSGNVSGVNIVNLTRETSTISDLNGEFYILVKLNDILNFTSINLNYLRWTIAEKDLNTSILLFNMTSKVTQLNEVILNKYPEINAVSLGISPKGIKKFTPAERRLLTAQSTTIDALLNKISGRTRSLEQGVIVEKKEMMLVKLDALYPKEYYIKTLKIPEEYVNGFQYYIVDDITFAEALHSNNKKLAEFLMVDLAREYKNLLTHGK